MKNTFFSVITALVLVGVGSPTLTAQAKFDLTGEWVFDVQTDQGSGSPSFVFKQTGEKLAGTYKGTFGEATVTGTVTGKTFTLAFKASAQGQDLAISYDGEIESNASVKGKMDIAGLGSGTFTGKRVK